MPETSMVCPTCGVTMNHHADKIDYSAVDDRGAADPDFGGLIHEAHTCPECGQTLLRPAAEPA